MNVIALAIPVFFAMIFAEYQYARRIGRGDVYRWNDSINDLSCGIGQQVTNLFTKLLVLAIYTFVWHQGALFDLSEMPVLHWVIGIVGYDFAYYWWHRFTHEVNVGWATHVVHHQSQDYNLAVALRQSMTGWMTSIPFYLPIALLGVNPLVFALSGAISLLYQFWIHTEVIDKLPSPIEAIWNTPAHHRVHHAINPEYLDKNYAAIWIVWDRMFGTFEPEVAQPVYGTVKPLNSFDPLWAQFWYFKLLIDDTLAARTWEERANVWLKRPGYRPQGLPAYPAPGPVSRETQVKYDPRAPVGLMRYVAFQFVPTAVGLTTLLLIEETAGVWLLGGGGALILWATWNWGAMHERKPIAVPSELVRLLATAAFVFAAIDSTAAIGALAVYTAVSAIWLLSWAGWLTGRVDVPMAAR